MKYVGLSAHLSSSSIISLRVTLLYSMRRYAIIPTRHSADIRKDGTTTVGKLYHYLVTAGWEVRFVKGAKSIYDAYNDTIKSLGIVAKDVVILCHDDIEILFSKDKFNEIIDEALSENNVGFAGVAGTPVLSRKACWWQSLERGKMGGYVYHGKDLSQVATYFGPEKYAVALDGVFLCAQGSLLNTIQLTKPKSFEGAWDFYDVFYTFQAHLKGFRNKILPLQIRHESPGKPRPSWDMNRKSFIKIFGKHLPATVK